MRYISEKLKTLPMWARRVLFAAYAVLMLYLMLIRHRTPVIKDYWAQFKINLNLIPFDTILYFIRLPIKSPTMRNVWRSVANLVGNVVMFFPLGFLPPWTMPKCDTLRKTLLFAAVSITTVEICQVVTLRGFCDIDDLMLNMIGAWVGYIIYDKLINGAVKK